MDDRLEHPPLAELALGAAGGHERESILSHVAGCAPCRAELAELSKVADSLLLLAPEIEPPTGFELRIVNRVKPKRRNRFTLAAAIVTAASLSAGAVWTATTPDRHLAEQHRETLAVANGQYLRAITLTTESGTHAGAVFLYQGNPSWLLVSVDAAPADGSYVVVLTNRNGRAYPSIGACEVKGGSGTTAYQVRAPLANIGLILMTGPGGTRLIART